MKLLCLLLVALSVHILTPVEPLAQDKPQNPMTSSIDCPVLVYHHLTKEEAATGPWATTPEKFEKDMQELKDNGYTPIFTYELQNALNGTGTLPEKPIILHFDDGYTSVYEHAFPILKKYNFKAETYIITDLTQDTPLKECYDTYLSWTQSKEMEESGLMHIYLHGKTHNAVSSLPQKELAEQYTNAQGTIALHLGNRHSYYVYPNGDYTPATLQTIADAGSEMQFVWAWKVKPQAKNYNVWLRVNIGRQDSVMHAIHMYHTLLALAKK